MSSSQPPLPSATKSLLSSLQLLPPIVPPGLQTRKASRGEEKNHTNFGAGNNPKAALITGGGRCLSPPARGGGIGSGYVSAERSPEPNSATPHLNSEGLQLLVEQQRCLFPFGDDLGLEEPPGESSGLDPLQFSLPVPLPGITSHKNPALKPIPA